jgi:hypothetical protein
MSWIIDNASTLHILFGLVAVAMVAVWRYNARVKYLGYAAGAVGAMALLWLLSINVKTDRQQLEDAVNAMAQGVENKQLDKVFKHISNDFRYKGITREMLYDVAQRHIKDHEIKNIRINRFQAEIDRAKKHARTGFIVSAMAERDILFRTEADFALEGEVWKLKTLRFYSVGSDHELDITGGR